MSFTGSRIQAATIAFLGYHLTHQAAFGGLLALFSGLPSILLMVPAGALLDRLPKRRMLLVANVFMAVSASGLLALSMFGHISPWHLLCFAFLTSVGSAVEIPARTSMIKDIVSPADLASGSVVSNMAIACATIVGTGTGGVLYEAYGPTACFAVNTLSYIALIRVLTSWRDTPRAGIDLAPLTRASLGPWLADVFREARSGVAHVRSSPVLMRLTRVSILMAFFGSAITALFPVMAGGLFGGGADTSGWLASCRATGSVLGSVLALRWLQSGSDARAAFFGGAGLLSVSMLLIIFLPFGLALVASCGLGLANGYVISICNGIFQTNLNVDQLRARATSFYLACYFSASAVGCLTLGYLFDLYGYWSVGGFAIVFLLMLCISEREDVERLGEPKGSRGPMV